VRVERERGAGAARDLHPRGRPQPQPRRPAPRLHRRRRPHLARRGERRARYAVYTYSGDLERGRGAAVGIAGRCLGERSMAVRGRRAYSVRLGTWELCFAWSWGLPVWVGVRVRADAWVEDWRWEKVRGKWVSKIDDNVQFSYSTSGNTVL
jgi:hypothetical protein